MSAATFLVIHGSRDPRPGQELAELLRQLCMSCPDALIGGGALEAHSLSLSEQIQDFSHQAKSLSHCCVKVFPLFLLPGVHVCEDIPAAIEQAQALSPLPIQCLPYLGQQPGLVNFLQLRLKEAQTAENQAWIFLGHGSRRTEAVSWINHLATTLQARPAYWTQPESLGQAVEFYREQGVKTIGIFPYLLFAGKLLTLITEQVETLNQTYSDLNLELTDCLRPRTELVTVIQQGLALTQSDEC